MKGTGMSLSDHSACVSYDRLEGVGETRTLNVAAHADKVGVGETRTL